MSTYFVTDHPYFGNLCGGFGAETRCMYFTTTGPCGRSPSEHMTPQRADEIEARLPKRRGNDTP